MTREQSVDDRIRSLIREVTPDQLPDRVFQATFERTQAMRQRRVLPGLRLLDAIRVKPYVVAVGIAVIIVLVAGLALFQRQNPSVGASPSPSPVQTASGQIAFERRVDSNTDIYMMNLDGTGLTRLTDDPANDWQPNWTPDGGSLVHTRSRVDQSVAADIFALDIASHVFAQLTDQPGVDADARLSPDGTRIAYDHWPSPDAGFHVMEIDGSNPENLFAWPDDTYTIIGWTSDGTGLYVDRGGVEILRLDIKTGDLESLVSGEKRSATSLSPDGLTFAYQSFDAPGGISIMNIDGSNIRHVTGSWTNEGPITWAPDGAHLAFDGPDDWLYVVGIDGSGLSRWTEGSGQLAWRPTP